MNQRLIVALLAVLAALTLYPTPAAAHAALVLADPAPGTVLAVPPTKVLLEFSERLDPAFSRLQLVDERGQVLAETTEVNPVRPVRLLLELGPLPEGSYTAVWRVRSTEDGHVTEGVVPFGVGVAADLAAVLPAPGAPAPALAPPPLAAALGRWLALVGAGMAVGAFGFGLLVWRPAWRAAPGRPEADASIGQGLGRLALAGAALVALGAPLTLLGQALSAAGPGGSPLAALPGLLTGPSGLLLGRLLVAAALAALALDLRPPGAGAARGWQGGLAVGALLLLTFPLTGHAGAAGALAPALVAVGLVHIGAMALWLGGLPGLLVAVSRAAGGSPKGGRGEGAAGPRPAALVRRFSTVAVAAVAAAGLSGVVAAWAHVGSAELLAATTYGRALVVKSALLVALIGLGALHMLVAGPRLRPGGLWAGRVRLTLGLELGLALALLAAAATQLSTAPSRAAWEAQQQIGQRLEAREGEVGLVLWVTPGQVGDNLLALDVADGRAGGEGDPVVLFRFAMPGHEMAPLEAEGEAAGGGRYETRGSFLSMVGRWEVEAIVRRPGMNDARRTFTVDVRGR